jgi:hypothetical protein
MIDKLDKAAAKQIAEAAEKALKAVAEGLGLDVRYRGGSYDPNSGSFKPRFEFTLREINGVERKRAEFERWAPTFNCKPEHFGARLENNGNAYTLIGFKPGSKYSVLAMRVDTGAVYKFHASILDKLPGRTPPVRTPLDVRCLFCGETLDKSREHTCPNVRGAR